MQGLWREVKIEGINKNSNHTSLKQQALPKGLIIIEAAHFEQKPFSAEEHEESKVQPRALIFAIYLLEITISVATTHQM